MELPEGIMRVECPEPVEGLVWVYILFMHNGTLYVGMTHNVAKRLKRHIDGIGARQTRQIKEFELVYLEGPMAFQAATSREHQLKRWSRAKKLALIQGDIETLKSLSKSRET
ncbi:MAG: GIY-YIG nuclease family protein [Puniceicoccales bacterium]